MNIFISNLNYTVRAEEISELFEKFGTVDSVKIVTDRETGRSRGFGFVEMSNDDEARNAIEALNQTDFKQRALNVTEAREPKSFGGNRGGGGYKKDFGNKRNW